MKESDQEMREIVREKYAAIAKTASAKASAACCGPGAEGTVEYSMIGDAYDGVGGYVAEADLGLGCGLPVEHAGLRPGQTVLDLGSGAGLDAFVARAAVGTGGRVIGVDMTDEMIVKARNNAEKSGFDNVEFRLGYIEDLPVASGSIDVVISNCVLNLVPNKARAFAEIFRVLRPGGHFCISDVVTSRPLPGWVKSIAEAYAGCVAGAIPKEEYLQTIHETGFDSVTVVKERRIEVPTELLEKALSRQQQKLVKSTDLHLMSVTVTASRPGQ